MDIGVDGPRVTKLPRGAQLSKEICKVQGAKGEPFGAQVIESRII